MTETPQDTAARKTGTALRIAGTLPPVLLQAEKVAQTVMRGVHGRRRTGQGESFWQFRHYEQGDSSRDIDWRQTAKRDDGRGDAYVRQREWEASQTLYLYRDPSPSMSFRSARRYPVKKEYAEVMLLAFAALALSGGELVTLAGTDLLPQAHYDAIGRIYAHLSAQEIDALRCASARPAAKNSYMVVFGDFYGPPDETAADIAALAARGIRGVLVQICDPAEEDFPFTGRIKFTDSENADATVTMPQSEAVRDAYRKKFAAHRRAIDKHAQQNGWRFMTVRTDEKPESALARLYLLAAGDGEKA